MTIDDEIWAAIILTRSPFFRVRSSSLFFQLVFYLKLFELLFTFLFFHLFVVNDKLLYFLNWEVTYWFYKYIQVHFNYFWLVDEVCVIIGLFMMAEFLIVKDIFFDLCNIIDAIIIFGQF